MTTIKNLIDYYSGFFKLPKVAAKVDKQIDTVYRRRLTKYITIPEVYKYKCVGCAFNTRLACPSYICTHLIFTKIPINGKK